MSFFFFKQKTAYEMRISDWSSDVCSSDLHGKGHALIFLHMAQRRHEVAVRRLVVDQDREGLRLVAPGLQPVEAVLRDEVGRIALDRSEERRVGKECVSTCRSRWSPDH